MHSVCSLFYTGQFPRWWLHGFGYCHLPADLEKEEMKMTKEFSFGPQ